ncbi:MAG: DUF1573 domain-containing protein [Bacteroidota bacterium]
MKKLSVLFLASAFALFFVACQTAGTANKAETASSDAAAAATNTAAPTQPTAPAPKQPEHIAKAEAMAKTTVEWAEMEYDFKSVPAGTKVTYQFKFKNTGDAPLALTNVKPSCGCTTPSYSKEEVAPGEEGYIDVAFNTTGKTGIQSKTVTVTGNFEGNLSQVLRIKGEVEAAPAN